MGGDGALRIDLAPEEIKNHMIRLSLSLWKGSPITEIPDILKKLKEDVFELFKIRDVLRPVLIAKGLHNFSPVEQLPANLLANAVSEMRDQVTGNAPKAKDLTQEEKAAFSKLMADLYPDREFKNAGEFGTRIRSDVQGLRKSKAALSASADSGAGSAAAASSPSEALAALLKRLRDAEALNAKLKEENAKLKAGCSNDVEIIDVVDAPQVPSGAVGA
eukprot:tig00021517_g22017.t1